MIVQYSVLYMEHKYEPETARILSTVTMQNISLKLQHSLHIILQKLCLPFVLFLELSHCVACLLSLVCTCMITNLPRMRPAPGTEHRHYRRLILLYLVTCDRNMRSGSSLRGREAAGWGWCRTLSDTIAANDAVTPVPSNQTNRRTLHTKTFAKFVKYLYQCFYN